MSTKKTNDHQALMDLIEATKIDKRHIADLAGINQYTFRMKFAQKPNYRFTEEDIVSIKEALCEVANRLMECCSTTKE